MQRKTEYIFRIWILSPNILEQSIPRSYCLVWCPIRTNHQLDKDISSVLIWQ